MLAVISLFPLCPATLTLVQTRAIRRRLTTAEANKKTLKAVKQIKHFSHRRVYALKA